MLARALAPDSGSRAPDAVARLRPRSRTRCHEALATAASAWASMGRQQALRPYVLRHGIAHALAAGAAPQAVALATQYACAHARLTLDEGPGVFAWEADLQACRRARPDDEVLGRWTAFAIQSAPVLSWPAPHCSAAQILLQLAVEHADNSPVTHAAEAWLAAQTDRSLWLRRVTRAAADTDASCVRVLDDGQRSVNTVVPLPGERLGSWCTDFRDGPDGSGPRDVVVWRTSASRPVGRLPHDHNVFFLGSVGDHLITWASDDVLRVWASNRLELIAELGGMEQVVEAGQHPGSSWVRLVCADGSLHWVEPSTGQHQRREHRAGQVVSSTQDVGASSFLVVFEDRAHPPEIWDAKTFQPRFSLTDGEGEDIQAVVHPSGAAVVTSEPGGAVRLWHPQHGTHHKLCQAAEGCRAHLSVLPRSGAVAWSSSGAVGWLANPAQPEEAVWVQHPLLETEHGNHDLVELAAGVALVMTWNGLCVRWDLATATLEPGPQVSRGLATHRYQVAQDRYLLRKQGPVDLAVWDLEAGGPPGYLTGHKTLLNGLTVLESGQVVTWGFGPCIRVLDPARAAAREARTPVHIVRELPGRAAVSSEGRGNRLTIWNTRTGAQVPVPAHDQRGSFSFPHNPKLREPDGVQGMLVRADPENPACAQVFSWSGLAGIDVHAWYAGPDGGVLLPYRLRLAPGHPVDGCRVLSDGSVVWWTRRGVLQRTWRHLETREQEPHPDDVTYRGGGTTLCGIEVLSDGRLLSWDEEGALRWWDAQTGACLRTIQAHDKPCQVVVLRGQRLVTHTDSEWKLWSPDGGLRTASNPTPLPGGDPGDLWLGWALGWGDELVFTSPLWVNDRYILWSAETGEPLACWDTNGVCTWESEAFEPFAWFSPEAAYEKQSWETCGVFFPDDALCFVQGLDFGCQLRIEGTEEDAWVDWRSTADFEPIRLHDDGTVVGVCRATNTVTTLQLHHGTEPVDLATARRVVDAAAEEEGGRGPEG